MTDNSVPPEPTTQAGLEDNRPAAKESRGQGLPLWMPLAGLIIAFGFALFVGVQVCPTLSGIVMPPSAPVPATGAVKMLSHDQKGTGLDEWLYASDDQGCNVARFYEKRLNECSYDPDSNCNNTAGTRPLQAGNGQLVVRCSGTDSFGAYRVLWTVYVSTGYSQEGQTHFRVIREVAN